MKRALLKFLALLATANVAGLNAQVSRELTTRVDHVALVGGTIINPADGKITRNATVFIDNGRISSIAAGMVMKYSGRTIGCAGKFILPGYIDTQDRKSTRLNSSHQIISYAVF